MSVPPDWVCLFNRSTVAVAGAPGLGSFRTNSRRGGRQGARRQHVPSLARDLFCATQCNILSLRPEGRKGPKKIEPQGTKRGEREGGEAAGPLLSSSLRLSPSSGVFNSAASRADASQSAIQLYEYYTLEYIRCQAKIQPRGHEAVTTAMGPGWHRQGRQALAMVARTDNPPSPSSEDSAGRCHPLRGKAGDDRPLVRDDLERHAGTAVELWPQRRVCHKVLLDHANDRPASLATPRM